LELVDQQSRQLQPPGLRHLGKSILILPYGAGFLSQVQAKKSELGS